jgi:hypothetical protein
MSQFYFATFTSTNYNMVTLATLLTATTFKTEPIRQMKRKPDQLQSKLTGSSSNNNFQHGFKEKRT